MTESKPLLGVKNLSIGIHSKGGVYTAVDRVSYEVYPGEIVGVVGESGCGKTVTNLAVMGLLPKVLFVKDGQILLDGKDLLSLSHRERQAVNGSDLAMVYQEPLTALNPLQKAGRQVGEVLRIHKKDLKRDEIREKVLQAFRDVDLPDPETVYEKYPHQLSGGQRQRVMIAMALIARPRLLIADEPTTALDVTVQADVLRLLKRLNRKYHMAILFISHDLGVIGELCDRVLVMYAGHIVERGDAKAVLGAPVHPYTQGLIRSVPTEEKKDSDLPCIPGRVPSTEEERLPCPFAPRCQRAEAVCSLREPEEVTLSGAGETRHGVKCHFAGGGHGDDRQ